MNTTAWVETPIYDAALSDWKRGHDGREPGEVLVEDKPTPKTVARKVAKARKPRAPKAQR